MSKLTPKDLSRADFEAWKEAPWFKAYLSQEIQDADDAANDAAKSVLIADASTLDAMRLGTAARVGRASAFHELQELEYEDLVEIELEVVANENQA